MTDFYRVDLVFKGLFLVDRQENQGVRIVIPNAATPAPSQALPGLLRNEHLFCLSLPADLAWNASQFLGEAVLNQIPGERPRHILLFAGSNTFKLESEVPPPPNLGFEEASKIYGNVHVVEGQGPRSLLRLTQVEAPIKDEFSAKATFKISAGILSSERVSTRKTATGVMLPALWHELPIDRVTEHFAQPDPPPIDSRRFPPRSLNLDARLATYWKRESPFVMKAGSREIVISPPAPSLSPPTTYAEIVVHNQEPGLIFMGRPTEAELQSMLIDVDQEYVKSLVEPTHDKPFRIPVPKDAGNHAPEGQGCGGSVSTK